MTKYKKGRACGTKYCDNQAKIWIGFRSMRGGLGFSFGIHTCYKHLKQNTDYAVAQMLKLKESTKSMDNTFV